MATFALLTLMVVKCPVGICPTIFNINKVRSYHTLSMANYLNPQSDIILGNLTSKIILLCKIDFRRLFSHPVKLSKGKK